MVLWTMKGERFEDERSLEIVDMLRVVEVIEIKRVEASLLTCRCFEITENKSGATLCGASVFAAPIRRTANPRQTVATPHQKTTRRHF